ERHLHVYFGPVDLDGVDQPEIDDVETEFRVVYARKCLSHLIFGDRHWDHSLRNSGGRRPHVPLTICSFARGSAGRQARAAKWATPWMLSMPSLLSFRDYMKTFWGASMGWRVLWAGS